MNMQFRPKIQNGNIAKRLRSGYLAKPVPRSPQPSLLATLTPLWSGVSVGELAQSGLAALGLDGRLQSTQVLAQEKTASPSRLRVCRVPFEVSAICGDDPFHAQRPHSSQ